MLIEVNRNPSRRDLCGFGITILIGLGVIGGLLWWLTGGEGAGLAWTGRGGQWVAAGLGVFGVLVASITLSSESAGRPIYVVWMTAAMWMGAVMVPVFMSVLFFVLLPVFSLIRLKDPLRMKLKREGTYWEPHTPHEATLERMRRPF